MSALAALMMGLALTGPNGLQVLHSPTAEQARQDQMVDRLSVLDAANTRRESGVALTEAEKRAAAWRADHLSCASRKGRTVEQYRAECGAWLAGETHREPAASDDQPRMPIRP